MTAIPTRWRTTCEEQLADAARRVKAADSHLAQDNGGRALQEAYPAVVAAATVKVWIAEPPWQRVIAAIEMQRRIREAFPDRFAALAALDLKDVLNSPWPANSARPYVEEAHRFVNATQQQLESWLAQG